MTSEVEICNLALSNIRAGSINSFSEGSLQAQVCDLKYPFMRDRLLTELPWQFNRSIRSLAVVTTEIFNWAYSYQYPVDCLKITRLIGAYEELPNGDAGVISRRLDSQLLPLNNLRTKVPFEVFNFGGNKVIGANDAELRVDYALKITDPNLFSNDFIMALSHLLASEIAIPLVGYETGGKLRGDSLQIYNGYLATAAANDVNDQYEEPLLSEFETIRR